MKAINLRGITESLSDNEMKLVKGGGDFQLSINDAPDAGGGGSEAICHSYSKSCKKQSDCGTNQICSTVSGNPYSPCCW